MTGVAVHFGREHRAVASPGYTWSRDLDALGHD